MGPLAGFRIVEIAGIGPTQFCGMLLADMGAELLRIERIEADAASMIPRRYNLMNRGRPCITLDLKSDAGRDAVLALCEGADALFEGFRPGVMERLGLAPEACLARNPKLVYGRMTGWGQFGPRAGQVGHDGNFVALAGALHGIGEPGRLPVLPANLLGDFGGGATYLAMGLLAALLAAQRSGEGQVVDAAMVDGVASLTTLLHGMQAAGLWSDERGSDLLNGGAPFYRCYATVDDKAVAVCALERPFYGALLEGLGITDLDPAAQYRQDTWPTQAERFAAVFGAETRDHWSGHFADTDACVTPVLTLAEAQRDPHLVARGTFVEIDGVAQPAPAPRFLRTSRDPQSPPHAGRDAIELMEDWGVPTTIIGKVE
ncbi:MAG: CaiB/BaiF CoA-transferase family protein [Woeseiaceae bacterium]|nr:CaiB/BaiF CoA-transferase family protein [Woeseiaceae bacterium]